MTDSSKRIFISYRNSVASTHARLLKRELDSLGYPTFLAPDDLLAGDWQSQLLQHIESRDHFILLLVKGTLEDCSFRDPTTGRLDPNNEDWVRKEVEFALETGRNIIPLRVDEYTPSQIYPLLTGRMETIKSKQFAHLVTTQNRFLDTSLEILIDQFLSQHPSKPSKPWNKAIEDESEAISTATESRGLNLEAFRAERLLAQGNIAFANGHNEIAISVYSQAIELQPNWEFAFSNRGNAYSNQQDYDKALDDFERSLEINRENMATHVNKAITLSKIGLPSQATRAFDEAIRIDSNNPFIYYNRGVMYSELGDFDSAFNDYTKAINLNKRYLSAYVNRAVIHIDRNRLDEAIDDLDMAISINSQDTFAIGNRGQVKYIMGDYEAAMSDFNLSLKVDTTNFKAISNRGETHFALHNFDSAVNDFAEALKLQPAYIFAKAGIAVTWHKVGNKKNAHSIWKLLVNQDERHMDADWVGKEYYWAEPLIEEARKLIASLKDADD